MTNYLTTYQRHDVPLIRAWDERLAGLNDAEICTLYHRFSTDCYYASWLSFTERSKDRFVAWAFTSPFQDTLNERARFDDGN